MRLAAAFMWLVGCSGVSDVKGSGDTAWDSGMVGGDDTGSFDTGGGESIDVTYWTLGATLALSGGVPELEGSSLDVALLGADSAVACAETVAIQGAVQEDDAPDAVIYAWWGLMDTGPEGDCDDYHYNWPVPSPVYVGVGAMDANIAALLEPLGLAAFEGSLYAAYASVDEGRTVYVYGVAGPEEAFAGEGTASQDAAPTDGVWKVVPIYPFLYPY